MSKDFLELSELLARVKECVADAFPDRYWVKGEISSWSPRRGMRSGWTCSRP